MCVFRSKENALPDCGGLVVSVPVSWFNNAGGWKDQFSHPNRTFVVAIVDLSHQDTSKHEMCIIGQPREDNFFIDQNAYLEYRAMWLSHGSRMVPSYELKHMYVEDFNQASESNFPGRKAPKKKTKGTQHMTCADPTKPTLTAKFLYICHEHMTCARSIITSQVQHKRLYIDTFVCVHVGIT
jgi:hypothetical protein